MQIPQRGACKSAVQNLNYIFNGSMKELPTVSVLQERTSSAIDKFCRKITKRKQYYEKFYRVLFASFEEVLKEEENICVCCGVKFLGKSIGPHYKNSKKCADFKRAKEGREEQQPRQPLANLKNQGEVACEEGVKAAEEEDAGQEEGCKGENYDELNEYFDSF